MLITSIFSFFNNCFLPYCRQKPLFNTSSNHNILDQSNFKAFADDILNAVQIIICVPYRVENIVGKGENDDYQLSSPFPTMFSKGFIVRVLQSRDCVVQSEATSNLSSPNAFNLEQSKILSFGKELSPC